MQKIFLTVLASALLIPFAPSQEKKANGATIPVAKDANWMKRHESFVAIAKKGDVDVLFLGDSITAGWEGNGKTVWAEKFAKWKPANFGIGGDQTQHVLWRITKGEELNGIDPKVAVIMIGTNNGGNSADEVVEGVTAIVKEIQKQKPKTKILLLGIFPRAGKKPDAAATVATDINPKMKTMNESLAKLDDGKMLKFLDIGGKFLNEKGELPKAIMYDYLHLSKDGYAIWADAIVKPVEEMLK